ARRSRLWTMGSAVSAMDRILLSVFGSPGRDRVERAAHERQLEGRHPPGAGGERSLEARDSVAEGGELGARVARRGSGLSTGRRGVHLHTPYVYASLIR